MLNCLRKVLLEEQEEAEVLCTVNVNNVFVSELSDLHQKDTTTTTTTTFHL